MTGAVLVVLSPKVGGASHRLLSRRARRCREEERARTQGEGCGSSVLGDTEGEGCVLSGRAGGGGGWEPPRNTA